jgi:hypothetical protein
MSGISGSGKSTHAQKFAAALILSADEYFIREDQYRFDPQKLREAHADCFRRFVLTMHSENCALTKRYSTVIIDNTNTTVPEISPYVLGALAFEWEPELVTILCRNTDDVETANSRNVHGVLLSESHRQHNDIRLRILPAWIPHITLEMQRK